jgi:hypothetical protein
MEPGCRFRTSDRARRRFGPAGRIRRTTRCSARAAALGLLAGDIALVAIYVAYTQAGAFHWFVHGLFNLDGEANLPAWYTSMQLLLATLPFLLTSLAVGRDAAAPRWLGALAAAGLTFVSADEIVGFHESITALLHPVGFIPRLGGGHGLWVPIYLGILGVTLPLAARACLCVWRAAPDRDPAGRRTGLRCGRGHSRGRQLRQPESERAGRSTHMLSVAAGEGLELIGATILRIGSTLPNAELNPSLSAFLGPRR